MKRVCGLFSFLAIVLLVPAYSQGATLQAGWFAEVAPTSILVWTPPMPPVTVGGARHLLSPGSYSNGLFLVTDGAYHTNWERRVTVSANVNGVGSSSSLVLPVTFAMSNGDPIGWMSVNWATNYDATQMRLELWRTRYGGTTELVWYQGLSGQQAGATDVLYNSVVEGPFFFKVNVLPEPASFTAVAIGLGALCLAVRRRRWNVMKRVCGLVLLLATGTLLPLCAAHAADLQAGWYAMIRGVDILVYNPMGVPVGYGGARFPTQPGTFGPYTLTDEPYHDSYSRTVRVLNDAIGVAPGTGLELPLSGFSSVPFVAQLRVWSVTDYDPSQMRLELVRHTANGDTVLWQQLQGGVTDYYGVVAHDIVPDGLAFRVVAVPEPSTAALLGGAVGLIGILRRGRRLA